MKMTRAQLKAVVKECLLEILSEGLGNVTQSNITGITENRGSRPRRPAFDPVLDRPVSSGRLPTTALKEAVKREANGNPLMAAIFADTAAKTLPEMISHGDGPIAGSTSGIQTQFKEQINGTPEEVFGEESAARWADLAFMETTKKSA